jgi:hypothetical protein
MTPSPRALLLCAAAGGQTQPHGMCARMMHVSCMHHACSARLPCPPTPGPPSCSCSTSCSSPSWWCGHWMWQPASTSCPCCKVRAAGGCTDGPRCARQCMPMPCPRCPVLAAAHRLVKLLKQDVLAGRIEQIVQQRLVGTGGGRGQWPQQHPSHPSSAPWLPTPGCRRQRQRRLRRRRGALVGVRRRGDAGRRQQRRRRTPSRAPAAPALAAGADAVYTPVPLKVPRMEEAADQGVSPPPVFCNAHQCSCRPLWARAPLGPPPAAKGLECVLTPPGPVTLRGCTAGPRPHAMEGDAEVVVGFTPPSSGAGGLTALKAAAHGQAAGALLGRYHRVPYLLSLYAVCACMRSPSAGARAAQAQSQRSCCSCYREPLCTSRGAQTGQGLNTQAAEQVILVRGIAPQPKHPVLFVYMATCLCLSLWPAACPTCLRR